MEQIICGVDLGGTKLAIALYTLTGKVIAKKIVFDHGQQENDEILQILARIVRSLLQEYSYDLKNLAGLGVAVAGHILSYEGRIVTSSNFRFPFRNYPFVQKLSDLLPGVKIVIDNDANAQALGEFNFGAGKGYRSMVFLTVSSGIGAGIILDGNLVRGKSGTAGEVGHIIVDYDSDIQCTCGNYGCAMALASGLFFPDLYRWHLKRGAKSTLGIDSQGASQVDGPLIARGVQEGDPVSQAIMSGSAKIVGLTLYNVFQTLNPEAVILGGGLMAWGEDYLRLIKHEFKVYTQAMMVEEMVIKLSQTGADAGLLGAASLVLAK